jgi:enamidase
MADAGVTLLGEVGLGSVKAAGEARQMVAWARKYGIRSTIHTGGPSIPGSGLIDQEVVLEADADVIGHINGGHTALPLDQITCLCERCSRAIELVHNGNQKAALHALRVASEIGQLDRVILGTDAPAGSGVQPLGILRMVAMLASLGDVAAETAFAFATGNTARVHGLNCGLIAPDRDCDLVFLDQAQHSAGSTLLACVEAGDLPGVGMVVIDGQIRCHRSCNTPPAQRVPEVISGTPAAAGGGH